MTKIHFLLDKRKQEQARRYEKEKRTLGLAGMALSLIILLSFYLTGLSGWAANLFIGSSIIWTFIVYWALFLAVVVVISFPLNFYSSYWHEHNMKSFFPQFLSSTRRNLALFPFFVIFAGAISGFLFGPLRHAVSRHFEKQSDQYALENIKDKKAFMTALAGLADRNLSNGYPEWWVKLLYYSHPPIGERLRTGELFKAPCLEENHVAHARF